MGRPLWRPQRRGGLSMPTTRYAVTGLTCGYCIAEVVEHVRDLVGVTGVSVDLTGEWRGDARRPRPLSSTTSWPVAV